MGEAQLKSTDLGYAMARAIDLVSEALAHLDDANAPGDIGAHLDMALHRMRRESDAKQLTSLALTL